jgi:hypothetical protein
MARLTRSFIALTFVSALAVPALAQTQRTPKTPWGDPDLQGTYSNSNESGIPMQRPAELAGKRLEEVTPAELAKLLERRHAQTERVAITIGGTSENDTGAGPSHWYENYNAKNSRAWMISDPPDGQMPALTPAALARAAAVRAARRGGDGYYNGPFDGPEDLTLYVRCISRGLPGSMMPAIYGNLPDRAGPGLRRDSLRDGSRNASHSARCCRASARLGQDSQLHGRPARPLGRRHARRRDDELPQKSAYGGASDRLKTTERFKLVRPGVVDWSITFDDANTWARPWTFGMQLTRDEKQPVFEYACHEGNEGLEGILKAARISAKDAARGKPVD